MGRSDCGQTSPNSSKADATPLHLVSAFASEPGLIPGRCTTVEKSDEITAIQELLSTLAPNSC
jgi:hypothetical protein